MSTIAERWRRVCVRSPGSSARRFLWRPYVSIRLAPPNTLRGEDKTEWSRLPLIPARIDSGADITVIPAAFAPIIGISVADIEQGEALPARGMYGRGTAFIWKADLVIAPDVLLTELDVQIGQMAPRPLLGMNALERLDTSLSGKEKMTMARPCDNGNA